MGEGLKGTLFKGPRKDPGQSAYLRDSGEAGMERGTVAEEEAEMPAGHCSLGQGVGLPW